MTNTNCLEGIKCPACGNEDSFRITATSVFTVTDDGTDHYRDVEWDDDSSAECTECLRHGNVKDFRNSVSEQPYFRGPTGTRYRYAEIAARIRTEARHTLGKHIFVQLRAIDLYDEFTNGTTPCSLPFTFADAEEPVDAERQRKAAAKLLAALEGMLEIFVDSDQLGDYEEMETVKYARTAIAAAETAGIATAEEA
jgi:hypothetical protein